MRVDVLMLIIPTLSDSMDVSKSCSLRVFSGLCVSKSLKVRTYTKHLRRLAGVVALSIYLTHSYALNLPYRNPFGDNASIYSR